MSILIGNHWYKEMLGSSYVCRMVSHLPELPLLQNGLSFSEKKKQIDKIRYKVKRLTKINAHYRFTS